VVVSRGFCFCVSVLAKRLAAKSIPAASYSLSSGTLNLHVVSQSALLATLSYTLLSSVASMRAELLLLDRVAGKKWRNCAMSRRC